MFVRNTSLTVGFILLGTISITSVAFIFVYYSKKYKRNKKYYETQRQINEYLFVHYSEQKDFDFYELLPGNGFNFAQRCAQICFKYGSNKSRALDIGCAVGRSTFELSREYEEVIGIDYSNGFIESCNQLKMNGSLNYFMTQEGFETKPFLAKIDSEIDRRKVSFTTGDACNLPQNLGQFDCVLGANLICRLNQPLDFLHRTSTLIKQGGILVLTSPFSWLIEFTPQDNWLSKQSETDEGIIDSLSTLKTVLSKDFELVHSEEMPFIIKETRRKHQFTIALCTVWQRF